jgi:diacylglycerol kinase family enzyme
MVSPAITTEDDRIMHRGFSTGGAPAVFIVNRRAGRFRKHPSLVSDIARAVGSRGKVFATASLDDLDEAARFAVTSRASAVVICGGDGTYLATVTALTRAAGGEPMPPIVLARGGTVSIVARNWGGGEDPVSVARRVVERPLTLRFARRPTLAVAEAGGERRVGFTFGTGLVANFFDEYERAGAGGNLTALRITLQVFAESLIGGPFAARILSPLPCRITADGKALAPEAYSLVLCSVLRDVGLHLLVTHRAGEDPARPHLVASPLRPFALGPQFPRVLLGRSLRGAGNFDDLVGSFDVEFADANGHYVLDGDSFHTARVTVSAGPVIHVAT